jgi:exopolysaccharide biosynthesis polyprenyl glycosylphosphotransferase
MNNTKLRQFFLLFIDILLLFSSLYITLSLRYLKLPSTEIWRNHLLLFTPIFVFWILILYINSLYDFKKFINQSKLIEQISRSIFFSFLLSIIIFYIIPESNLNPKTNLIIFSIIFYVLFLFWRLSFSLVNQKYLPNINIGIIGYNEIIRKTIQSIKSNQQLGYEIKFILNKKNNVLVEIADHYGLDIIEDANELAKNIKKHKINILVIEKDIGEIKKLQKTLFNLLPSGINFCDLSRFYEEISGQVPIEILSKGWFLENLNLANKRKLERIKRVYDLFLSSLFLLISLPFWPIIFLLIKMDSPGPFIFKQKRVGKDGKHFTFYKFRSMKIDNNDQSPAIKNDKRITKIGKFMRQSRVDEIPQLFNVLKGDMSFVGPRPEKPELIRELSENIPFYNVRHLVKPGITGWDQISGEYHSPSIKDTHKKLQHDLFYIKNRTIYLDISIILKTIRITLEKQGI